MARGASRSVLSESAAKRLGFGDAQSAIGQAGLVPGELGMLPATVVGVVADVRHRTVREPPQPIIDYDQTDRYTQMLVRFQGIAPSVMLARAEAVWERLVLDIPFAGRFVDDIVKNPYNADDGARSCSECSPSWR